MVNSKKISSKRYSKKVSSKRSSKKVSSKRSSKKVSSKRSSKKVSSKNNTILKEFYLDSKSIVSKKDEMTVIKKSTVNMPYLKKPVKIYNYKIMTTYFNKKGQPELGLDNNNKKTVPNLIIELKPGQKINGAFNFLRYADSKITQTQEKLSPITSSVFKKVNNLINFKKFSNNTNQKLNLCLKPDLPCKMNILNIHKNKDYFINPIFLTAYSDNLICDVSKPHRINMTSKEYFKLFMHMIAIVFVMIILALVGESDNALFGSSKRHEIAFNMLKINTKTNNDNGILFLTSNDNIKKIKIVKGEKKYINLGSLIVLEGNISIYRTKKISNNLLNNKGKYVYITLEGEGVIYCQEQDLFKKINA